MTTAIAHKDDQGQRISEWFAAHRATFTRHPEHESWPIETLLWAKPGTGMYSIRYVIQGPVLMVWGDLESAVYRWSSPVSWEFLAGCDLQYFEGKCEASPKGRDYEDYDHGVALIDFDEEIKRRVDDGYDEPDKHLVESARRAIKYGTAEWHDWMQSEGYLLFGRDWSEVLPGLGMQIAQTCAAHLTGIKMAVAQRAALRATLPEGAP